MTATDETWEQIAQECIQKAERIECPLYEFARGLRIIQQTILERQQLAEAEVENLDD